ncbi:hypothetical protein [Bosea sp. 124]|uniref:hypothetical protein n=1 Tax=Bosea sp. 124 TaxID=2135642 RepID=UPI000D3B18BE|nr:hypothetical protein [Bosea sp. 124]
MAAIADLVAAGSIIPIEVNLRVSEQPLRLLYGTENFVNWLQERLEAGESSLLAADLSPAEQLEHLFHTFISGRSLVYSRQFRFIRAETHAVWELKTPDIRIFGWFLEKDCFVAVFGDWADRVKDYDLYRGYRIEIRRLRRQLGLVDTLCVKGTDPSEVLSL